MDLDKSPFKIIVAHPDDEVLFFNSLLTMADKIIVSFGGSNSTEISEGRNVVYKNYPLKNVDFLGLPEAEVYDGLPFATRNIIKEGVSVQRNSLAYSENYEKLRQRLKNLLMKGDTVFTHNPWGEYGHPEHVQVFSAVQSLIQEFELNVYVNGYVSDKSFGLMLRRCDLLSAESFLCCPDPVMGREIKNLYVLNNCWTWSRSYVWPLKEIFYRIADSNDIGKYQHQDSSYPPLNFLTQSFKKSRLNYLASIYLPENLKSFLKKILKLEH